MMRAATPSGPSRDTSPAVRRLRLGRPRARTLATLCLVSALAAAAGCSGGAASTTTDGAQAGSTTTATTAVTVTSGAGATSTSNADSGPGSSSETGGSPTTVTYAPPYTGTTQAGVPLPPLESNALARELKRTMDASLAIASVLREESAPDSDPRASTIYALRARAQAITARRAIVDRQLTLADEAVKQLGLLLAQAGRNAEGETASAVAEAETHMALMAFPSADVLKAASALDHVIADLAPLVPEEATTPTS